MREKYVKNQNRVLHILGIPLYAVSVIVQINQKNKKNVYNIITDDVTPNLAIELKIMKTNYDCFKVNTFLQLLLLLTNRLFRNLYIFFFIFP